MSHEIEKYCVAVGCYEVTSLTAAAGCVWIAKTQSALHSALTSGFAFSPHYFFKTQTRHWEGWTGQVPLYGYIRNGLNEPAAVTSGSSVTQQPAVCIKACKDPGRTALWVAFIKLHWRAL